MKKHVKRLEAIMLGITMLFSMPFSGTAMAAGKTSANQMTGKTHTAQTTAVEDAESPKTTFPVHVIHKTGNDKENFVIVIMGGRIYGTTAGSICERCDSKGTGNADMVAL